MVKEIGRNGRRRGRWTYMEFVTEGVVHDEGRGQHAHEHEEEAIHQGFRGLRPLRSRLPAELRVCHG